MHGFLEGCAWACVRICVSVVRFQGKHFSSGWLALATGGEGS